MNRCGRCGAIGTAPCTTPTGAIARSSHQIRVVDEVGEIERLTSESVDAATWIQATDQAKVGVVMSLAREADKAVRLRSERYAGATPQMFDVESPNANDSGPDGTFVYLVVSLGLLLDSLGLSPKGRRDLSIESVEEETDDLAEILKLHNS